MNRTSNRAGVITRSSPSPISWATAILFLMTLVAYSPVTLAGFIWDDPEYVIQNVELRTLSGLWRIWFVPGATPQYYPLVFTTFWAEYHLWKLNPLGYHVDNVVLHALNAILLYRILSTFKLPVAFLAAAIFAVSGPFALSKKIEGTTNSRMIERSTLTLP